MDALARAHDAAVQMIDTSVVRVHQHGSCIAGNRAQHMGRSPCCWQIEDALAICQARGQTYRRNAIARIRSVSALFSNRARNLVERFFNKIKHCRRVATRYDKLAANYLAFVKLACIRLWLRVYEFTA